MLETAARGTLVAMHLTMAQTFSAVSTFAIAWTMVRLGVSKGALHVKVADRCAACGRRRTRRRCPCADSE
jgi:hypothetical protein